MAKEIDANNLAEVHALAKKRFNYVEENERDQRKKAIEDALFAHSEEGQWEQQAIEARQDRPRFTVNLVAPVLDQLVGDQRQNRFGIEVKPSGGNATKPLAEIFAGLIRNIESDSHAATCYDNAYLELSTGGYGGWRINTAYNDDDLFDQDIIFEPIRSAASSLYFGPSKRYDKRDAPYAFLTTFVSEEQYKADWPNAQTTDFEIGSIEDGNLWFREKQVRIAEYWVKVPVTKKLALLSNDYVIDVEEEKDALDELALQGVTIVKERTVETHEPKQYIMNGCEILEGPNDWAGKYIPLIPAFGKEIYIEGKAFVKGIVRNAKDANRIYNYTTSSNIETLALSPKDPYWLTYSMVGDDKAQFQEFNKKNQPFMFYEPDEAHPGPPSRTGAPSVQQASMMATQQAGQDVRATTGMHAPAMGDAPSLLSEKSVMSQAEKGDRGSYIFEDNIKQSVQYTGDILIDLIPKIYDTKRAVTVLGIDGATEIVEINEKAFDEFNMPVKDEESGEQVIVNNLAQGKYLAKAIASKAYTTRQQESLEKLIAIREISPELASFSLDLIAENVDIIQSEEMVKRARKMMIQQGMVEPTEEEIQELGLNQPQKPDPTNEAVVRNLDSQSQKNMADAQNKNADTYNKMAKSHSEAVKNYKDLTLAFKERTEAGIPITPEDMELLYQQAFIIDQGQESLLEQGLE